MNGERLELLARVASMYYESDMTQAQVALRTGYSRSMISRLWPKPRLMVSSKSTFTTLCNAETVWNGDWRRLSACSGREC